MTEFLECDLWRSVQISWAVSCFHRGMLRNNGEKGKGIIARPAQSQGEAFCPPITLQICQGEEVRGINSSWSAALLLMRYLGSEFGSVPRQVWHGHQPAFCH